MKQPIVGDYSWSPQQMARVNAQRESRGQAPLVSYNGAQQSPDYEQYYNQIKNNIGSNVKKSQYDIDKEKESNIPIQNRIKTMSSENQKKRELEQNAFREKFRKQQMLPRGIGGMRGAVSSPLANSLERFG